MTLREFYQQNDLKSIFLVSTANPSGYEITKNLTENEDEYCDPNDCVDSLGFGCDELDGTVNGDTWTWDGDGSPRDYFGNSYLKIQLTAEHK